VVVDVVVDGDGDGDVVGNISAQAPILPVAMLSFQKLDVYRCSVEFLALAFEASTQASRGNGPRAARRGNGPILDQLRRAATSIPLNIAEAAGRTGGADAARCYAIARGSAMECAAILDALQVLQVIVPDRHRRGSELLERIVAMLTKLCR
jgi:four helix bundle protein